MVERDQQRQEFTAALWHDVVDEQTQTHSAFEANVALTQILVRHFAALSGGAALGNSLQHSAYHGMGQYFDQRLLPQVREFAATREEEAHILVEIFRKAADSLVRPLEEAFRHQTATAQEELPGRLEKT
jgi:hypothetical protein